MRLLEEELARANLSKECLADQRHKSILELVKTRTKAEEDEAQLRETIRGLERTIEGWKRRCQDVVDSIQEQASAAAVEISFWKDRLLKLSWLANQALRDIPRSLRTVEGMADFVKTPKEITSFLGLYRGLLSVYAFFLNISVITSLIPYSSPNQTHGASDRRPGTAKHADEGRGRPDERAYQGNKRVDP
ncbi:hypothetical protein CR513_01725, partial [Mucuna pruriens]